MTPVILVAHLAATLLMTGLIWFVQVVHYPLFARLDPASAPGYAREHQLRTTRVVAPLMLVEAATAVLIVLARPAGWMGVASLVGLALLVVIWLSTAFVQVPEHARLARAFDAAAVRRLVLTNWIRTAAWSIRAVLAIALLVGGVA